MFYNSFLRSLQISVVLIFTSFFIHAQQYLKMMDEGHHKVEDVIKEAEVYFKDKDKGRGSGYKQFKRWEYMALRMMDEDGYLKPQEYYIEELERFTSERIKNNNLRSNNNDFWEEMGPDYWNATSGWNPGVGRLTSLSVELGNPQHIIVGSQTGGVWRTYDAGMHWEPLTDYYSNMVVYATAIDPQDPRVYYFGSTNGRIYKSFDAGASWSQFGIAGNSQINKLLIHPEDPEIIFASGENSGIFRSEDGGFTWRSVLNDSRGFDVEFKPGDLSVVYASGNSFHRSVDGGETFETLESVSGDISLLRILEPQELFGGYHAVDNNFSPGRVPVPRYPEKVEAEFVLYQDPAGEAAQACEPAVNASELKDKIAVIRRGACTFVQKVLHAQEAGALAVIMINNEATDPIAMGGGHPDINIPAVMVSQSFGNILAGIMANKTVTGLLQRPESSDLFRNGPKMIAVTPANPELVYVLEAAGSIFGGLYKSSDSGQGFERLNHEGRNYFGYSLTADDTRGQAPRDMDIVVHPEREDEVHIGGILSWMSRDGGVTMEPTSDWIHTRAWQAGLGYNHADIDIMEFIDGVLYLGTDGGLYKAESTEIIHPFMFEDMTTGLGIRQFYKIGITQSLPTRISGGSQDNGTSLYREEMGWIDWLGADGMETFFDKNNRDLVFGTSQNGVPYRSSNGGMSRVNLPRPGSESGNWVTPFEADPIQPNTIYLGYEEIFKSTDNGDTWTSISIEFPGKLNEMKIAPTDNQIIFASQNNNLYRTKDGGDNWVQLGGIAGRVNYISIHPTNPDLVAIATNAGQKVFISRNGGDSWSNMRRNLPDFTALCVLWDDNGYNGLYVGMNYGIFYLDDRYDDWVPYNNYLPNVRVNELEINYEEGKLYAGTYGRGLWVSDVFETPTSSVKENKNPLNVKLFPNPTNDLLQISTEENLISELRVYDYSGRLHFHEKNTDISNRKINVSNLQAGTYILLIANTQGVNSYKFTKI
jgi:photosystem II stability/assembly factor-like uncharacterized protein